MKLAFLIAVQILFLYASKAQVNLVPNPSFEDTLYCPSPTADINALDSWENWSQSPDYFNACNHFNAGVPNNSLGYQEAHSGNAYVGIITYALPGPPGGPNYREIIGEQLSSPLVINQKYFVSFYVNCTFVKPIQIATNKMGLLLSTVQYSATNPPPIINVAQLYTDSIITDSLSWTKISGSFIADSAYTYVMLGNFFDDNHIDTLNLQPFPYDAYYFFDDLCITTDSLYNNQWTGLENIGHVNDNILIYPNPINDIITISHLPNTMVTFTIYDVLGKKCLAKKTQIVNASIKVDLSLLSNGIYTIKLFYNSTVQTRKIIIHHIN